MITDPVDLVSVSGKGKHLSKGLSFQKKTNWQNLGKRYKLNAVNGSHFDLIKTKM